MLDGMRLATEGLMNCSVKQDIITNNLANVTTTGFRKESMVVESFSDVMVKEMGPKAEISASGSYNIEGHLYHKSMTHGGQGALKESGNPFDLALDDNGNGFFTIQKPDGKMEFTRAGSFKISTSGFLVTADGSFVMGQNGPIKADGKDFKVTNEGVIQVDGKDMDRMLISQFQDLRDTKRQGATNFAATAPTVKATGDFKIHQGYLEQANFNPLTEMVELMQVARNFEANQKALSSHDQRLQKTVNELGKIH